MESEKAKQAEKSYISIGHFIAEFSQAEFTIRYYLADEIRLSERYFEEIIETYDVGILCKISEKIFLKNRIAENGKEIKKLLAEFTDNIVVQRNRVAHALWVPHLNGGTTHNTNRLSLKSISSENASDVLDICTNRVIEWKKRFIEEVQKYEYNEEYMKQYPLLNFDQ